MEISEEARSIARHHASMLHELFPALLPLTALETMEALPQDVRDLSPEVLDSLPPVDLFLATWPCQDLSGAHKGGKGLEGPNSSLFWTALKVLRHLQRVNPALAYFFENVHFKVHHEGAWATVCAELGQAVVLDAAVLGPAHRRRAYWMGEYAPQCPPVRREDRDLRRFLDYPHAPNSKCGTEQGPAGFNIAGRPRRKHCTVVATQDTFNVRDQTAFAWDVVANKHVPLTVAELHRLVGLFPGAYCAPGVPEDRQRFALGNLVDGRAARWLFSFLPFKVLPGYGPQRPKEGGYPVYLLDTIPGAWGSLDKQAPLPAAAPDVPAVQSSPSSFRQ